VYTWFTSASSRVNVYDAQEMPIQVDWHRIVLIALAEPSVALNCSLVSQTPE
jgi:hypothetical protein